MNFILLNLNFKWDDGDETTPIAIITNDNVSSTNVIGIIKATHDKLCRDENDEDIYGTMGRTAETLMNEVCKTRNWKWHEITDTIDLD